MELMAKRCGRVTCRTDVTAENPPHDPEWRERYDRAMLAGALEYYDVINHLDSEGLPTTFIQTGGMNAALQVQLKGGPVLLITDQDDSLAWVRDEHQGWGVGLYASETSENGAIRFRSTEGSSLDALLEVIHDVMLLDD